MNKVGSLLTQLHRSGQKGVAWLVDPEKEFDPERFRWVEDSSLDLILIGGSSKHLPDFQEVLFQVRLVAGEVPICLFPGSHLQVSPSADAILFLSLISGRNAEYLIGQQMKAALEVAESGLEVLPTGYILVNEGEILSVHSVSQTLPILNSQIEQVEATALAGKLMGMSYFFLDAGSGAQTPVASEVVMAVKRAVKSPVLVGGGLNTPVKVKRAFEAGADLVVLGNGIEKDPGFLSEVLNLKQWFNHSLNIN